MFNVSHAIPWMNAVPALLLSSVLDTPQVRLQNSLSQPTHSLAQKFHLCALHNSQSFGTKWQNAKTSLELTKWHQETHPEAFLVLNIPAFVLLLHTNLRVRDLKQFCELCAHKCNANWRSQTVGSGQSHYWKFEKLSLAFLFKMESSKSHSLSLENGSISWCPEETEKWHCQFHWHQPKTPLFIS